MTRTSATGRKKRRTSQAGFTAIELSLVLTVLAVAAAAVLPAYPQYARGQRLKGAASRLAAAIRYVSDWSALHEQAVVLAYDDEQHAFILSIEETDPTEGLLAKPVPEGEATEEIETPELDNTWRTLRLPEDVTLEAQEVSDENSGEAAEMRFLPDGRCDDAVVVLAAGELRRTIRVEGRRGRVLVEEGDTLGNADLGFRNAE